jgi:nucleoside-diphosphate-sugar epimerase
MREVVTGLAAALERPLPRWQIPASFVLGVTGAVSRFTGDRGRLGSWGATAQKWLADDVYEATKFQREFGFQARVELQEGLRREVNWYKNRDR